MLNYTENYQLPQWEETDRVLMDDFNAANGKMDEVLGQLHTTTENLSARAGIRKIKTLTVSSSCTEYPISLSDIQWDDWKAVHILVDPYTSTWSTPANFYMSNGDCIGIGRGNEESNFSQHTELQHLIFYPMFDGRRPVCATYFSPSHSELHHTDCQYSKFQMLYIRTDCEEFLLSGSRIEIWGEK